MSSEWKWKLRSVFKKLLISRLAAALVGLGSTLFAAIVLPDEQYAIASVVIAYGAIFTSLLYSPFAKFALVGDDRQLLHATFRKFQVVVVLVAAIAVVVCAWALKEADVSILIAGAAFASAQGAKFYFGDMARAGGDISGFGKLYLFDALTTLVLVVPALCLLPSAETYLATSAASTFLWCAALFRFRADEGVDSARLLASLGRTYTYSMGVIGVQGLNAATMAAARTALVLASPPGMAGQVQFLLDLLQKPMSLISSSISSAIVPEMAKKSESGHIAVYANWAMMIVLILSLVGSVAAAEVLPFIRPEKKAIGAGIAALCAVLTWSNRYKSSVLEAPLTASIRASWLLPLGGVVSLVMTLIAIERVKCLEGIAIASAASLLVGGFVSASGAAIRGLISAKQLTLLCLSSAASVTVITMISVL